MLGILKFWALRRKWKMLALFLSPLHGPSQLISFKWKPEKFLRQKWRVDWPGLISDLNCYVSRTQTYSSIVSYIEPQCISVLLFLFAGLTIKVCLYEEPDHLPVRNLIHRRWFSWLFVPTWLDMFEGVQWLPERRRALCWSDVPWSINDGCLHDFDLRRCILQKLLSDRRDHSFLGLFFSDVVFLWGKKCGTSSWTNDTLAHVEYWLYLYNFVELYVEVHARMILRDNAGPENFEALDDSSIWGLWI